MFAKMIFAATSVVVLGFSSGAMAQTFEPEPYAMGPAPMYGDGPAVEDAPMMAPDGYDNGYAPRRYYAEPGYNDGYQYGWRDKIRQDQRNETNGVDSD
jgi:hypothetical protein